MNQSLSAHALSALAQLLTNTAAAYGQNHSPEMASMRAQAGGLHYSATPTLAQRLFEKLMEDGNPFLSKINMLPVTEISGQKVGLFLTGRAASRTNTATTDRSPKRLYDTDAATYLCKFTEFDTAITYAQIDTWAKFPDFAARYMALVRKAIGNDILQTGWTGTSAATATNIGSNPLLQDLNIGWLKQIRDFNSASQYVIGTVEDPIDIGSTGAFKTLDALVHDAKLKLHVNVRENPDLVALVSRDLLHERDAVYFDTQGNTPTEKVLLESQLVKAVGGLPPIVAPFMPANTLLVTPLSNLSVYYQDTAVRRTQVDNPKRSQTEEYSSMNLDYVVEFFEACSLVENITWQ